MTARPTLPIALMLACFAGVLRAQQAPELPFQPGERLEFGVRLSRMGASGHGAIWIDQPDSVRGVTTWTLHSDAKAGVGFISGTDRTTSWLDPVRMAALRFVKHENRVFTSRVDSVEIYPEERRWRAADGKAGEMATSEPLDELSFIYFIRTLAFADDSTAVFVRHFDLDRTPTTVRLLGRETVKTKGGTFETLIVEMRVRDPRNYQGTGVLRINLSDDARRLPVRIQSVIPEFGTTVMSLERVVSGAVVAAGGGGKGRK